MQRKRGRPRKQKLFVLFGPSGSGKSELGEFLKTIGIPEVISHTTRKPRRGEIPGETYHYVTKEEFDKLDKVEETNYDGYYYGITKNEVQNKLECYGKVFVITDRNGLAQLKDQGYPVTAIFVYAPAHQLFNRIKNRSGKTEAERRLAHAVKNKEFTDGGLSDYIIANFDGKLEQSQQFLKCIVG